jgi:hypothetical protein
MRIRRWAVAVLGGIALTLAFAGSAQAAQPPGPQAAVPSTGFAFNIINFSSNKCLQPQSWSRNAVVVQRTCDRTNFLQRWTLSPLGDGYSFVVNQGTGFCMDLQANSEDEVGNGTLVQQFDCFAGYTSEHWNFVAGSRVNHYQVFNLVKGLCLDLKDRSSANGAVIQVWSCKFLETAQEWRFVSVS